MKKRLFFGGLGAIIVIGAISTVMIFVLLFQPKPIDYPATYAECVTAGGQQAGGEQQDAYCSYIQRLEKNQVSSRFCPAEYGRIYDRVQWCGDFPCEEQYATCELEFNNPEYQATDPALSIVYPKPEDVYALAKKFDEDASIESYYRMSNTRLHIVHGANQAIKDNANHHYGVVKLRIESNASQAIVENQLRAEGFTVYTLSSNSRPEPFLVSGYSSAYYRNKGDGFDAPYTRLHIPEYVGSAEDIVNELSSSRYKELLDCTAEPQDNAQPEIVCIVGSMSADMLAEAVRDNGGESYTLTYETAVLVPYTQEQQMGEYLATWPDIASYELFHIPN